MTQGNVVAILNLTEQQAKEILEDVITDTSRIKLTKHARERMKARKITFPQVIRTLGRGRFDELPTRAPGGSWKMTLSSISAGQDIKVACALDCDEKGNYVVVITAYLT